MTHTIDLQAINRGLGTLASLMQVPEVRTTVAAFHADFTAASQQIDVLGDYKDVHDNLHQLQFLCYNSIVTQSGRFPGDDDAVDIITDHEITALNCSGRSVRSHRLWLFSLMVVRPAHGCLF